MSALTGLDVVRSTTVGHLVLGSGFDPRDFAAYAGGVLAAVTCELLIVAFRRRGTLVREETRQE